MKKVFTLRAFIKSYKIQGFSDGYISRICEYSWLKSCIGKTEKEMRMMGYGCIPDWFEYDVLGLFSTFLKTISKGAN